jgi:hypothetical protein
MPAVRVRATTGWQDLTLQGAPGRSGGWQEIGYVEATADVPVTGTGGANANTILTLPALIFDGATTIELEFWSRSVVPAAAANAYIAWGVWQDGVQLGVNAPFFQVPSGAGAVPAHIKTRIKPAAGSHTYSIRAWSVGGTGTICGGQSPGCMMFFSAKIVQPQGMGPPLVTSLPSNPLDGQEVYYLADAANGIIWHLRYRAASTSAYKWEIVGQPPPLFADWRGTSSGGAGYVAVPAAFTRVALPLAGDYDVKAGLSGQTNSGMGAGTVYLAIHNDLHQQLSTDDEGWVTVTATQYDKMRHEVHRRLTGIAAGRMLDVRGKQSGPTGFVFYSAFIAASPIRVGS